MKARVRILCFLCLILTLCSLCSLSLPSSAQEQDATQSNLIPLQAQQTESCEPGGTLTLHLSLPEMDLAGGFMTLEYDTSLFTLKSISLLQATEISTLTYKDHGGSIRILLDSAQNAHISGAFLSLCFASNEEIQPGAYKMTCTVPDAASFYALAEDGSTYPLHVSGCATDVIITAPILPECPARYLACQETNPANGQFLLRICALVAPDATLSRGSYGFACTVTDTDGVRELTLAGSALADQIQSGDEILTAEKLGGSIYTATLTLPCTGEVRVSVTPYVYLGDHILYGGTYTVLYRDGAYIGTEY